MKMKISELCDCLEDDSVTLAASDIVSVDRVKAAVMGKIGRKKCGRRYGALLIAAAALLALSVGAAAVWHFGLRDMAGPSAEVGGETRETLILNGISGSPEFEAAREWEEKLSYWFEHGENLAQPDSVGDAYFDYGAISEEAHEALDELLGDYGLTMHDDYTDCRNLDSLYSAAGISGFVPERGTGEGPFFARLYSDGTLLLNSSAGSCDYQLYSLKKGTFTRIGYLLADAADFESWTFIAPDGTEMLLALSGEKGILAADLENCFVFINFRAGTDSDPALNAAGLEDIAAQFDLSALDALCKQ